MTARDLDQAWNIVDMCARMPDGNIRMHIAEQIALLLAELRATKKALRVDAKQTPERLQDKEPAARGNEGRGIAPLAQCKNGGDAA